MLGLTSGALLAAGLWPGALSADAAPRSGNFEFLVVNDLHHLTDECSRFLERVVTQMRGHTDARLCLILGDLSDTGQRGSFEEVRRIFGGLRIPVHVMIGNHDYATPVDRAAYEAVYKDQINYHVRYRGWQFVCVDSTEGQKYHETEVPAATLEWLDRSLPKLRRDRPTVLCTHFPMAEGVNYRPKNADALLDRFRDFNLRAVFSGHYHSLTEREGRGGIPMTTNRCCSFKRGNHDGSKEKGYFLCRAKDGSVSHEFVEVKPS